MNIEDILKRFTAGMPSAREEKELSALFNNKKHIPELQRVLRSEWELQEDVPDKDIRPILHKLHFRINTEKTEQKIRWNKRVLRWSIELAAAVLLAAGLTFVAPYILPHRGQEIAYAELQAPKNARVQFRLPDGTDGWLNSGATLKYPLDFSRERTVSLWGEAFFSVAKQKDKEPFTVLANNASIVVWGTRFNVNADENGRTAEVVLEEGKVEFRYQAGRTDQSVIMTPGDMLVYDNKQQQHVVMRTNSDEYTQWINGRFVIRGESVAAFAKQFGRRFNMDIIITDQQLENLLFRATFENESPEEIMRLLALIVPIDYRIEERQLMADGTFTKKRVTLSYNNKKVANQRRTYE